MRNPGSREACADRLYQSTGASGLNIEKPIKQADARKRLIFSFKEIPEVKEAVKKRDEVRAAVAESLVQEPLSAQVEKLRDDVMKTLRKLNDDDSKTVNKGKDR